MFQGTPEELLKTDTLTAEYLKGEKTVTDVTDRAQTASLTDRGKAAERVQTELQKQVEKKNTIHLAD